MLDMDAVRCELIRWVNDHPQPGLVEVSVKDADGLKRTFVDKVAIFTSGHLSSATSFPIAGVIRCEVLATRRDSRGQEVVYVRLLDGFAATDEGPRMTVPRDQLVAAAPKDGRDRLGPDSR
jgi:hypothetical protein